MRATVQHFEIPVDDLDRAATFYRTVFGWRVERLLWDGPAYCTVRVPESRQESSRKSSRESARETSPATSPATGSAEPPRAVGGGLMERGELRAEQPLLVIHIEDGSLDEVLRRIDSAGGAVEEPPRRVGGMGEWARFRDSEGNHLALWQAR